MVEIKNNKEVNKKHFRQNNEREEKRREKREERRETRDGRRETGDGRREKGEGRREKGEGRRERGEGRGERSSIPIVSWSMCVSLVLRYGTCERCSDRAPSTSARALKLKRSEKSNQSYKVKDYTHFLKLRIHVSR